MDVSLPVLTASSAGFSAAVASFPCSVTVERDSPGSYVAAGYLAGFSAVAGHSAGSSAVAEHSAGPSATAGLHSHDGWPVWSF